jgi:hypothetical protein
MFETFHHSLRISQSRDTITLPAFTGTTDWSEIELTLDLAEGVEGVTFHFQLSGAGQIWVDDVRLESVGPSAWTPEQTMAEQQTEDHYLLAYKAHLSKGLGRDRQTGPQSGQGLGACLPRQVEQSLTDYVAQWSMK